MIRKALERREISGCQSDAANLSATRPFVAHVENVKLNASLTINSLQKKKKKLSYQGNYSLFVFFNCLISHLHFLLDVFRHLLKRFKSGL